MNQADPEFLENISNATRILRKPYTGIVSGYHKLPYILIGRNKRIRESDLQAWIDANLVNYEFPFQLSFLEPAEHEKK